MARNINYIPVEILGLFLFFNGFSSSGKPLNIMSQRTAEFGNFVFQEACVLKLTAKIFSCEKDVIVLDEIPFDNGKYVYKKIKKFGWDTLKLQDKKNKFLFLVALDESGNYYLVDVVPFAKYERARKRMMRRWKYLFRAWIKRWENDKQHTP